METLRRSGRKAGAEGSKGSVKGSTGRERMKAIKRERRRWGEGEGRGTEQTQKEGHEATSGPNSCDATQDPHLLITCLTTMV